MDVLVEPDVSDAQLFPFVDPAKWRVEAPLVITRGEGVRVYDREGRAYIEAMSGLWSAGLGFSDAALIEAACGQLRTLPFYHNFMGKLAEPSLRYGKRLAAVLPEGLRHVFFANSGSEAVDTAIKILWRYNNAVGRPAKKRIIARWDAYHGSGILSGSASGMPAVHEGFDLPLPTVLRTGSPHYLRHRQPGESERAFSARRARELADLIAAEGADTIAAMIAEPMIGSGGVMVPPEGYWNEIQAVLEANDIMLVADEVICGFGRTGAMFGSETFGLRPHLMTLAKQLTSSYVPMAAVAICDAVYEAVAEASHRAGLFAHGFTYSGHPVAAAVGLAVLDRYEELDILPVVRERGEELARHLDRLRGLPGVIDTRSVGLLGAVEFDVSREHAAAAGATPGSLAGPVVKAAQERGVIFRPLGDIVGICPPLVISPDDLAEACRVLGEAIVAVYGTRA